MKAEFQAICEPEAPMTPSLLFGEELVKRQNDLSAINRPKALTVRATSPKTRQAVLKREDSPSGDVDQQVGDNSQSSGFLQTNKEWTHSGDCMPQ